MRHLFVVDSLDKHIQNEKELIRPRRILPAARATRARSAQFYVVLICHDSTGVGGLFCICVESINLKRAGKILDQRARAAVIERPPGVPFQKIQFGMHAGGRSVLLDSRTCEDLALYRNS